MSPTASRSGTKEPTGAVHVVKADFVPLAAREATE